MKNSLLLSQLIKFLQKEKRLNTKNDSLILNNPKEFAQLSNHISKLEKYFLSQSEVGNLNIDQYHFLQKDMEISSIIELLQREEKLNAKNCSLFTDNFEEYIVLVQQVSKLKYYFLDQACQVYSIHSHWLNYSEYARLVDKFLTYKTDGTQFCNKFVATYLEIERKSIPKNPKDGYKLIQTIEFNSNSIHFNVLLEVIYKMAFMFANEPEVISIQTDEDLREEIKVLFPNISEYY